MKRRLYVRTNGNGEVTFSKLAEVLAFIVMLLGPLVTVSVYGATIKRDVELLNAAVPGNTESIRSLESGQVKIDTQIEAMHEDIKEIKQDVKLLLRGY